MLKVQGLNDFRLHRFIEWAIKKKKPLTLTYLKHAKDKDGNLLWERREGAYVPVLEPTIRTIEPWYVEKEGSPDAYVRGMDRDSKEPRSWRLDRIQHITYHRRGKQIIPAYVSLNHTKKA